MAIPIRAVARSLLGVRRVSTYLPWLSRPGVDCVILVNNVEARFKQGYGRGPDPSSVRQYDADGSLVGTYDATLASSVDTAEVRMQPTRAGCGFATVDVSRALSDLYVTLSYQDTYTATHGRHEFIEYYPVWTRILIAILGYALALGGRTIPAFARDQYVYVGPDSRSHLLLMNLSNVTNRIRVAARVDGCRLAPRLLTIPPMGSRTLHVDELGESNSAVLVVRRLRLEGNAWFNVYLVEAGPEDLAGPLSLMHVK